MIISRKTHYLDISHLIDDSGQLTKSQLEQLGLTDITYSEPEFTHDCEMSNGFTLGYYQARDDSIWRSDYVQHEDKVELHHVSLSERKELRQALED